MNNKFFNVKRDYNGNVTYYESYDDISDDYGNITSVLVKHSKTYDDQDRVTFYQDSLGITTIFRYIDINTCIKTTYSAVTDITTNTALYKGNRMNQTTTYPNGRVVYRDYTAATPYRDYVQTEWRMPFRRVYSNELYKKKMV